MFHPSFRSKAITAALSVLALGAPAYASGFALRETSGGNMGRAFAGDAAMADSAAIVWANPAGMTRFETFTATAGINLLFASSRQSDIATTRTVPGMTNPVPTGGGNGGNPFNSTILIPSIYAVMPVSDKVSVGIGVNAPFGLKVEYEDGWFGRYDSLRSELTAYNIQPSIAYKLNEFVSIGGGLDIQALDADLSNNVPNLSPLQPDGFSRIKGDDVSLGWNLGILADIETLRFGVHYRSRIKHKLDGSFELAGLQGPLAAQNSKRPGVAPLTTPDKLNISAMFSPQPDLRLLGSVEWVNWSVFDAIRVNVNGQTVVNSPQQYKDSWSFHLGAEKDLSEDWTLRAGLAADATPTIDAYRSTRVPDGNRVWLTTGASWRISEQVEARLSYAHVFVKSETLDRNDAFYENTPAEIHARIHSRNTGNVDILGADITVRF